MTDFSNQLCVAVPLDPPELLAIAQEVASAIDPDTGGHKSFDAVRACDATIVTDPETGAVLSATPIEGGQIWAICHSPCTPQTAGALPFLRSVPGLLYQSVTRDFAERRADQTPPTLEQCEAFRTAIKIAIGTSLEAGLAEMGLVRVTDVGNE